MRINIQNVEDLIFHDKDVWRSIPDLIHLRDQWRVSKMAPMLRAMGRKALIDFLNTAKGRHEKALSEIFGTHVTIDSLDGRLVKNVEFNVGDDMPEIPGDTYSGCSSFRRGEKVFVTFWR